MGVPGLWRILDLASQPLDLEKCAGLRLAVDINSHANRLVHSQSASNWIYMLARDLFRILHFNIRIVIVFMGRRPLDKIYRYSTALGDESQDASYYRVRSLILRSNKHSPNRETKTESKPENSDPFVITPTKFPPRKRVLAHLEDADNINDISKRQVESISQSKPLPSVQFIHHSNASGSYIFFEQNDKPKDQNETDEIENQRKNLQVQMPQDQSADLFYSSLLDDVKDIISESDPSSEGAIPPEQQNNEPPSVDPIPVSLLPADESYFPPIENYVTATHIRLIKKLCDVLGVPYIQAPEEACAECARLEKEGIVDAVASDDNNSVLFGSNWMIRGIFTRPQSITIKTLEKAGITRERMIMIAMMIDGDYNSDIRKRLFTVGPVRGMEILSFFPDEKDGLYQFKDWWIRVVKNKKKEENGSLKELSKMKWLKKLIMPENFPPVELLNAFNNPIVGDEKPLVKLPKFNKDDLILFLRQSSSMNEERIKEHTNNFAKRMESFDDDVDRSFLFCQNELKESPSFIPYIDRIQLYDKKMRRQNKADTDNNNNNDDDDDEWDTVSDTGTESSNENKDNDDQKKVNEEEEDKNSINDDDDGFDSIENDDEDSIEEDN